LIQTRYLGIDGTSRRSEPQVQIFAPVQVEPALVVAAKKADGPVNGEEEKAPQKKREQKAKGKLDDNKSDVTRLTHTTNKTASGALKRHCEPCGKLIANWADHKKKVHRGNEVPYEKCFLKCSSCKGKCFKYLLETYRQTGR